MPTFLASIPERNISVPSSNFDFDIDTGGQVELHQRVHGLGCRVNDIQQTLMRADLELIAGFSCPRGGHAGQ